MSRLIMYLSIISILLAAPHVMATNIILITEVAKTVLNTPPTQLQKVNEGMGYRKMGPGGKFVEPKEAYSCLSQKGITFTQSIAIIQKNYLDETCQTVLQQNQNSTLELFVSPGEIEPITFLIAASEPLEEVMVSITDLKNKKNVIPADVVSIRRVVRSPMRKEYTATRSNTKVVNRFLPRWKRTNINKNEFREVWLSFDIPQTSPTGLYKGKVVVNHKKGFTEIPITLEIMPIELITDTRKKIGIYYNIKYLLIGKTKNSERIASELQDMDKHGIRTLILNVGIEYINQKDQIIPDTKMLRESLNEIKKSSFKGREIVIGTGLEKLAIKLGYHEYGKNKRNQSIENDKKFFKIARSAMLELRKVMTDNPEFTIYATHMDEIFKTKANFDLYISLSKAVKQVPEVKLYITFDTLQEVKESWRETLDPYMDLRGNHGTSFEMWLMRGHTMQEYKRELSNSGDKAWFYHNQTGIHWTSKWSRIINGIYLWVSPFDAHVPYIYQTYFENPFDDTDGPEITGHDYGFAFPSAAGAHEIVPTRTYEAMREGWDDLRYISTLENLMDKTPASTTVSKAKELLNCWRSAIKLKNKSSAIEKQCDLPMFENTKINSKSPVIDQLSTSLTSDQINLFRRKVADMIVKIQQK